MESVELLVPETEQALLATMLQHRMAPLTAQELGLTRADFGYERNGMIHDAIMRIVERGSAVDTVLVIAELEATGLLEAIGGKAPIERLGVLPSDPGMVGSYVELMKDRAMRRSVQTAFEKSMRTLHTEPDTKAALALVQKHVYRAFDEYMSTTHSGVRMSDLRTRYEARENTSYIPFAGSKLTMLSNGGRARGSVTIWGGHTNHGKTTQMVAEFIAMCELGYSADYYALEMTEDEMVEKVLAQLSGVPTSMIRDQSDLSNKQRNLLDDAWERMTNWTGEIIADPEATIEDVRARQLRNRRDGLFIDYLQRYAYHDYKVLASLVKAHKNLALQTNCTIDIGSQINPGEIRPGQNPAPIPGNNNLFGGKTIGFEANNIIHVWARQEPAGEGQWKRTGDGLYVVTKLRGAEADRRIDAVWNADRIRWEEDPDGKVA